MNLFRLILLTRASRLLFLLVLTVVSQVRVLAAVELNLSTASDKEQRVLVDLMQWIEDHGGVLDDRQVLRRDLNIDGKRKVYAGGTGIPAGAVLLRIPWKLVLAADDPESDDLCHLIRVVQDQYAIYEQQEQDNVEGVSAFFNPFLAWLEHEYLRDEAPPLLPDGWSAEGQDLLSSILDDRLPPRNIGTHLTWYREACIDDRTDVAGLQEKIALMVIAKRSNGFQTPSASRWQETVMPGMDLYTHRDGTYFNTRLESYQVGKDVVLVASRHIQAYEPIHWSSGMGTPMGTTRLLLDGGFVEELPRQFELNLKDDQEGTWHWLLFDVKEKVMAPSDDGHTGIVISWPTGRPTHPGAYRAMRQELTRLNDLLSMHRHDETSVYNTTNVPKHERDLIFQYYNALVHAIHHASLDEPEHAGLPSDGPPFELLEDFDIGRYIRGNEEWWEILQYRGSLKNPTISFYEDKVALKRWLPVYHNVSVPPLIALNYASELPCDDLRHEYYKSILELLPRDNSTDFVAKPSHKAESYDLWIVKHDREHNSSDENAVWISLMGMKYKEYRNLDTYHDVATSLADSLYERPDDWESWALLNVKPGLVVEERIHSWDRGVRCETSDEPSAMEFKVFIIWGKAWVAQWYCSAWKKYWSPKYIWDPGFVWRDGSMVGDSWEPSIPEWVDWSRVIELAERVGSNKDMLRVDILVGVPSGSLGNDMTDKERVDAVEYMVSELEFFPSTLIGSSLASEGARLWREGYTSGHYKTIYNMEVPIDWRERYGVPTL